MSKITDITTQLEQIVSELKEHEVSILEVSTAEAIEELVNNLKHELIFKWSSPTGVYMINGDLQPLTENKYYVANRGCEGDLSNLHSVYFSDRLVGLPIYQTLEEAADALVTMPIDGSLAFYIGESINDENTVTRRYTGSDGNIIECSIKTWYNSVLVSAHEDTVDEHGNILRKYRWDRLMTLPVGTGVGTLDAYVTGGVYEFDVKDYSKVRVTACNGFEYIDVDALPTPDVGYENKICVFDNKNYIVAAIRHGDAYEYRWIECEINIDGNGGDAALPIITDGGRTVGGVREEWFAGTCTFDVADYETFTGHAPEIMYIDIEDASEATVTDHNTLYTDRNGDTWMLAKGKYDNYTYVRCSLECDINGWDALVPIIE